MKEVDPLAARVGVQVRALRHQSGLNAVDLAQRTGISQPFLSQIERGLTAPSLTTLYALARALEVPMARLLSQSDAPEEQEPVVRASEGIEQFARVLVNQEGPPQIEALEHHFTPGEGDRDWFQHPGSDLLYVVEGQVELQRRGHPAEVLQAGSAQLYDGEIPHRCVIAGDAPARTLIVAVRA